MTRIILTRHGQIDGNARPARFHGRAELSLSEAGHEQARAAARRIASAWEPRAVYTSPMGRCLTTGQIIADALGLIAQPLAGLNDIDYGEWQGLTGGEARARWPEEFERWSRTPHLARIPSGETLQAVRTRVAETLRTLVREHRRDTIVVVGHTSVNRLILLRALELPLSRYRCLAQDNCAVSELISFDGRFHIKAINETYHLRAGKRQ